MLLVVLVLCSPCTLFAISLNDNIPKVSIIIPVYNVEQYLKECMDSVLNQTLNDIEIICVDDCSTDNSLNILKEYTLKDDRIKLIEQPENRGAYVARNSGLKIATGEYIGFVDPDDYIELSTYEKAYEAAKSNDSDMVVFGGEPFEAKSSLARSALNTRDNIYIDNSFKALLNEAGSLPFVWNKIYKRSLLMDNNIKFEEERNGCDKVFCWYIFPTAKKITFISNKLYHYRIGRSESAVNDFWNGNIKSMDTAIKNNKCIINRWLKMGYAQSVPDKFLQHYINFYFSRLTRLREDLKKHYAELVFKEIFTDDFISLLKTTKISNKVVEKFNSMKSFMD